MKNEKNPTKSRITKKKKAKGTPPLRGIRLREAKDVVKLLNKLINQVLTANEEDEIRAQNKLRTVAYSLTMLLKAFEISGLSERIEKIEEFIRNKIK